MTTRQKVIVALALGGAFGVAYRRRMARRFARILAPRQGEAGVRFFERWYLAGYSACIVAAIVLLVLELLGV
jgi:hypothetical protein